MVERDASAQVLPKGGADDCRPVTGFASETSLKGSARLLPSEANLLGDLARARAR